MNQPTQPDEITNQESTPVVPALPSPSKLLIILVVVLLLIVISGAGAYFMWMKPNQPVPPTALYPTPTSVDSPSASSKIYNNKDLNLSFQYPIEWTVQEASPSADPEEIEHLVLDIAPVGQENQTLLAGLSYFDNPDNLTLTALEAKRAEKEIAGMAPAIYLPTDQDVTLGQNIPGFIRKDAMCEPVICDIYTWQYKDKVFQLANFKDTVPNQNKLFNQIPSTFRFTDTSPANLANTIIVLQRNGCYGTCPIYKLTIYGDGKVVYEGKNFVKEKGSKTTNISQDEVARLVSRFNDTHYFSLNDKYDSAVDTPWTVTSITIDGKIKSVSHIAGDRDAPRELTELEDMIDVVAKSEQWVK